MATSYALPLNGSAIHSHHGHNGHNHGHTRSHHRKAAPDRLPLGPTSTNAGQHMVGNQPRSNLSGIIHQHTHSRSLPLNNWKDTNHVNQQNFQNNTLLQPPDRRSGMDSRLIRPAPSHTHAKKGSYGFSSATAYQTSSIPKQEEEISRKWMTITEVATSILVPLPYWMLTLITASQVLMTTVKESTTTSTLLTMRVKTLDSRPDIIKQQSQLLVACAITSGTLLLVGCVGKLRGSPHGLDNKQNYLVHSHEKENMLTKWPIMITAGRIGSRILGVGLPVFAATKLGGSRVAMVMLITAAGDFPAARGQSASFTNLKGWGSLFITRKWTLATILLGWISDLASTSGSSVTFLGYLALGLSIFLIPLPLPTSTPKTSILTSPLPSSANKTTTVATPFETPPPTIIAQATETKQSPMIFTLKDTNLTLIAGALLAFLGIAGFLFTPTRPYFSVICLTWILLAVLAATLSLTVSNPKTLRTQKRFGLALGLMSSAVVQEMLEVHSLLLFACQGVLVGLYWFASKFDTQSSLSHDSHSHSRTRSQTKPRYNEAVLAHDHGNYSKFTGFLLHFFRDWPLLHSILVEKDSRRILYFMCLNFGFMLVQTFYAVVTGSLGLLSDSIHMLFDCLALVVGLCAAVMSKWPPSIRFPYGFGKMDTLAGFANGIFLMLISIEIIYEAVERLVEGSEMQRIGELLTVSSLGLVVNLIGMTAFGHAHHGHGHSHGHSHGYSHDSQNHSHEDHSHESDSHRGHSHDHKHNENCENHPYENHNHNHSQPHRHQPSPLEIVHTPDSSLPFTMPPTPSKPPPTPSSAHTQNHSPGHSHPHHHHGHDNMHGIFLHILADTLGSVAVVISTILIHYTGWSGFDPLASCLIAILIFASAIPLVTSSARTLLLTVPEDTEFDLREALAGVGALRGIANVCVPRFWMGEGEDSKVQGVMHVVIVRGADMDDVRERAGRFLEERNMNVIVQVEREGEGRCWCGGGSK